MTYGKYPEVRLRRLRQNAWTRRMVAETELTTADLIQPLFVHEHDAPEPIPSMPGISRYGIKDIIRIVKRCSDLGIPAIALFPVTDPKLKTEDGKEALNPDNLICRTIRAIKKEMGNKIGIIADVALDPYTTHGHDGLLSSPLEGEPKSNNDFGGGKRKYNQNLPNRAQGMRKQQTPWEKKLWYKINNDNLGVRFRRQQAVGNYIADFINFEKNIIIELDGSQHVEQEAYDRERDEYLTECGFKVLRFWNNEVNDNIEEVVEKIAEAVRNTPSRILPSTESLRDSTPPQGRSVIDNDKTVEVLCKQAVVLAEAGADIVAPSDMMDGRVGAIREALDIANLYNIQILSYAAKYASSFYGPFRDAVGSKGLLKGDKQTYQMDPRNADEAIREVALDIEEGADMVMVKPGLPYLDVIRRVREEFKIHVMAYQVSGEYSMIKAAADAGYIDYHQSMMESLIAMKRAGAVAIFTYAALETAEIIRAKRSEECSFSG